MLKSNNGGKYRGKQKNIVQNTERYFAVKEKYILKQVKINKTFEINRWQIVISCVIINLISTN